ncbi:TonB-dependent receptor [Alteromonas sp. KS69]|uniref:TonB-dependent receptor n=1 Tax=Alteromonas sp. KS69 TaxID=2109917 RepID=UPI000F85EF22|nr:TonB-dependent receptor [Alteromonas sp. KS69]RUP83338.1 TonB-dependent receptor [Alteromonas sp. KS69]
MTFCSTENVSNRKSTRLSTRLLPSTSLLALAISSAISGVHAQEIQTPDRDITDIEKIVVIGEKANRSLKDSTTSISVFNEEAINNTQYKSVSDAISDIANVVVQTGSLPDIRGVSGNGAAGGFNSISGGANGRVMTLIDGVSQPFVADLTGDSGMWDLQQIEVYRGPQSTSNGRNSIGGAVYIKTNDPSQEWEGAARVGYRNNDQYIDTAGVISGPLIEDELAFRLSVQNLNADTITDGEGYESNPPDYDIDKIETQRVRGKLLWTPSDDLSFTLSHTYNNEEGDTGRVYYALENLEEYNRIYFRDISTESSTTALNTQYVISDNVSLDLLISFMDYKWGFDSYEASDDAEQTLIFDETNVTVDAKINFALPSNNIDGFVGLYYFEREQDILSTGAYPYYGSDESESIAVYGETTFALSDKLNIIAGVRVERESQFRHFVYEPIDSELDDDTNIFLPKFVIQYAFTPQTTLAFSARKGYNAGGGALNFTAQEYYYYEEEKVNTFELSSRTQFENGAGFVSANIFYNDYDGFQALSSTRFITNMPSVATYGAELEVHANVTDSIEVNAGMGFLQSEIKDAGADYTDAQGNELNSAPSFNANVGAKYWVTDAISVGGSVRYIGEYFGDFTNTAERVAGDYTIARFTANYTSDNWLLTAYLDNAFDETALVSQEPVSTRYPSGYAAVVDPRTVGVSATYRF